MPPRRWQFDGGVSFRHQSGHLHQSMVAVDLRPSADGSTVRISLMAGGGKAAGSQRAFSLGSCAMGQTGGQRDRRTDRVIPKYPSRTGA